MTEHELATLPEAKLGGALLWMIVAAMVLCLIAMVGVVFAFQQYRAIGIRYMIAVGFIAIWSIAFVVMTLLRASATPVLASAGLFAWIVYRFAVAQLSQAGWPVAADSLGEVILAAGFYGYMANGMRPNAYYRRRLRG